MLEPVETSELVREDRQPTSGTKAKQANQLSVARHQLGEAEQKLLLYAIAMIDPRAKQFCQYRIEISAYAAACGISGHNLKEQLWNAAVAIQRDKPLLILDHVDPDGSVVDLSTHWFAEVRRGAGYIDVTFPPSLSGYLGDVKQKYFRCELGIPLRFRGEYAIRLYQWLKSWQFRGSKEISLADLRVVLGLVEFDKTGKVSKERLDSFGETKKWALAPALAQINKSSDISVGMKEIKVPGSKRVESVLFTIMPNPEYVPDPTVPRLPGVRVAPPVDSAAVALTATLQTEFGLTLSQAQQAIAKHGVEDVQAKAAIVRSKPCENAGAYLLTALKKGWHGAVRFEKKPAKKAAPAPAPAPALVEPPLTEEELASHRVRLAAIKRGVGKQGTSAPTTTLQGKLQFVPPTADELAAHAQRMASTRVQLGSPSFSFVAGADLH